MTVQSLLRILVLAPLMPTLAAAETTPDRTGTGGGPRSTITAPHTTATGVTKPPGIGEGPATPAEQRELQRIERENDRIDGGICDGCGK